MKKVFLVLLPALMAGPLFAQNPQYKKDAVSLQVGVGFLSPLLLSVSDYDAKFVIPPVSGIVDYAASETVSIGAYIANAKSSVRSQKYSYIGDDEENPYVKIGTISHIIIGARGLYHYELTPRLDTYLGAMIGYNKLKVTHSQVKREIGYQAQGLTYNIMVGAKMPIQERFGAFFELGYGVSIINLGLSMKL